MQILPLWAHHLFYFETASAVKRSCFCQYRTYESLLFSFKRRHVFSSFCDCCILFFYPDLRQSVRFTAVISTQPGHSSTSWLAKGGQSGKTSHSAQYYPCAKMAGTDPFKIIFQVIKELAPAPTSGLLTVVLLSCVLFGVQTCLSLSPGVFSIGASVFLNGHLHRLFMYPFYHKTSLQLFSNITALVFLSGSLEKGFGTVRFLFLFLLMSISTGLVYSFLDLLQETSGLTEGLLPVALACVALTTMHTKMTRGFLCGVSFPTMALPWMLLVITTVLVPHSVLPCNIIAVLVGCMCGRGWFSLVDLSEARAGVLEKTGPFRSLRSISGDLFVPASTEERRKTLLPQVNPTPGSYPVQAYAPVSSSNAADATAKYHEGWLNSTSPLSTPTPPLFQHAHSFAPSHGHFSEHHAGHSCNHSHGHWLLYIIPAI